MGIHCFKMFITTLLKILKSLYFLEHAEIYMASKKEEHFFDNKEIFNDKMPEYSISYISSVLPVYFYI